LLQESTASDLIGIGERTYHARLAEMDDGDTSV
jgi:hypothetical protein